MKEWIKITLSSIISLLILTMVYIFDNQPFSLSDGPSSGQWFERSWNYLFNPEENIPEDMVTINIAYDRELAPVFDEFGFPMGEIDVTDRGKLIWLLQNLKDTSYKYLIFDISFSDDIKTSKDSLLFELIATMPRLFVVKQFQDNVPEPIASKAKYSEYANTLDNNNFSKYDFWIHGEKSLPLAVCEEIEDLYFEKKGLLYFVNGHLAYRALNFPLKIKLWNQYRNTDEGFEKNWFNLGADIIDMDLDVKKLGDEKIVFIGDFSENDIHDTYIGPISGPVINMNAIETIRKGGLVISYWAILYLFIIYTLISYSLISRKEIFDWIKPLGRFRNQIIRWALSSLGVTAVLTIISFVGWIAFGGEVNIVIPAMIFSAIIAIRDFSISKLHKS